MKEEMICVVHIYDSIFAASNAAWLDKMSNSFSDNHGGTKSIYELEVEGTVQDFLSINMTQVSKTSFQLSQTGFIKRSWKR
jgi:hypothetical protein